MGRQEDRRRGGQHLAAGSVVLTGPAGIGKSTLLTVLADDAQRAGHVVLHSTAAPAESALPYLALIDLFVPILDQAAELLPEHLLHALRGALLREGTIPTARDELAVRLAVLDLLRGLTRTRDGAPAGADPVPVLLVLDDVQWIDRPSAEVLEFVARRLGDHPVRVLAAERVEPDRWPISRDLCPPPVTEIPLRPLDEVAIAELLSTHIGTGYPRSTISRIYKASGGNPFYALELARALERVGRPIRPTDPLPVPDRLRVLLSQRLATLPPSVREALLLVAVAARPTGKLLSAEQLAIAERAGILELDSTGHLTFTHPLLSELVYADADSAARQAAHRTLADLSDDPIDRAWHLALGTPWPDTELAHTLEEAARMARNRGAPAVAAELARLAAERTTAADRATAAARMLTAARHALAAGLLDQARESAQAALAPDAGANRDTRVHARLLLVEMAGQDQSEVGPILAAAFADAVGYPRLEAGVRLYRAVKALYDGQENQAVNELIIAEGLAEYSGDVERLVEVLTWRGCVEGNLGDPNADRLHERAWRLAQTLPLSSAVINTRQLWAMTQLFMGNVSQAVRLIERLADEVEREGTLRDLAMVLISVSSVNTRAGRLGRALRAGRRCAQLFSDMGVTPGPGFVAAATAELAGGTVAEAGRLAEQAVAACQAAGDDDWLILALALRGQAHLLAGERADAVETLRHAWRVESRYRRNDPAIAPWYSDFIEALVGVGAHQEAAEVLTEVRSRAERRGRHVVLLGLRRAEALLRAATVDSRQASDELRAAIEKETDHPYPLDLARCYLTLGMLERRAHRRSAARHALQEALRRFTAAGAAPWVEWTRAELARLDGGARGQAMTETEQRIVDLVRAGATNREIAATLFLSVKAVEANLTRLYRRLGVRNRTQLVRALQG